MKYIALYILLLAALIGFTMPLSIYAQGVGGGAPSGVGAGVSGGMGITTTPKSNGGALGNIQGHLDTVGRDAFGENTINDPMVLLGKLINVFLGILALIFLILMLYGGFLWMTALGDQERITKAKDTIIPAVIGIVIIVGAYAVTSFVIEGLVEAIN